MTGIYLLLGSNLGDKSRYLADGKNLITKQIGPVTTVSSLYLTEPWGMSNVPSFLNQVLELNTLLEPHDLLEELLKIEGGLGRTRQQGYKNRTLDIDILYYGHLVIDEDTLTIPHPRISERRFVLEPLVEIAPDFEHPVLGLTNQQLLDRCTDTLEVIKTHQ